MAEKNFNVKGLTEEQVLAARQRFGSNRLEYKKENNLLRILINLLKEPMVILLLVASFIYFFYGKTGDGIFLTVTILLVSAISLYQDSRSRNALEKLKNVTQPHCKVIRNQQVEEIKTEDLVVGDSMLVEEGATVAADGSIVHSHDFSVNESVLTGESVPVSKAPENEDHSVYRGTSVVSGLAVATVTAVGRETRLGKIGKTLEGIKEEKTPLERQINNFVKKMVIIGVLVFVVVWMINFFHSYNFLDSLLKALTLAMSILPEEIPVAFTTFMALGAWRLMKMGIVVKQMKTVETLGSATVICTDKTGTITENKMSLAKLFVFSKQQISDFRSTKDTGEKALIRIAMWASEPIPFDPMEIALHEAYSQTALHDERNEYNLVHEYPLGGMPPMMTHVFENESGKRIIAAKGAPEALLNVSRLEKSTKQLVSHAVNELASEGYRVLGVGETIFTGNDFPAQQQEFPFTFKGLVAFYDPPKKNIPLVLKGFYTAGIDVRIITGDNATTTRAIAKEVGFRGYEKSMTGEELLNLSGKDLQQRVADTYVFSRMFPEAKLKVINALKANKEIVAMTGDGVNDGPALKAAHIGIAMGKKGTEIAKQAASLILFEDDLSKMVDAIAMGRKIYTNLKKAIRYIISIHIPIILTVFIPLALGWIYPNIFTPVHIIFLELIMGPTCSIIYENEPLEKNIMHEKPRPFTTTFFNSTELITSAIQGLMIATGTLAVYQYAVSLGYNEALTRTMVFITLISANIFLTLENRSFYYSIFTTLRYRNNLVQLIIALTIVITAAVLFIGPITKFFRLESPDPFQLMLGVGTGFIFVIWYEAIKWVKRAKSRISSE